MRRVRGRGIAMIFQAPPGVAQPGAHDRATSSASCWRATTGSAAGAARARARELWRWSSCPTPAASSGAYPHELSGGMCQRAMIALALACRPALLVADEADHGARRDRPAPDPPAAPAAARGPRPRPAPHHPQPRAWSPRCASGSRSCTRARSSRRRRPARCSPRPGIPTRAGSWPPGRGSARLPRASRSPARVPDPLARPPGCAVPSPLSPGAGRLRRAPPDAGPGRVRPEVRCYYPERGDAACSRSGVRASSKSYRVARRRRSPAAS